MAFHGKFCLLMVAMMASLNDNVDAQYRTYYPGYPEWVRHISIDSKRDDTDTEYYCPKCKPVLDLKLEKDPDTEVITNATIIKPKRDNFQQRLLALDQLMHEYLNAYNTDEESRQ